MTRTLAILALLALAACGAEGDPIRPSASVGVGSGGTEVGGSVGLSTGNVSLGIGV